MDDRETARQLLEIAARLWARADNPTEGYGTGENPFLGEAEAAWFRAHEEMAPTQ